MPPPKRVRVAPGVTEIHATRCSLSKGGRRCTCEPAYFAEARSLGQRLARSFPSQADALLWLIDVRQARRVGRLPETSRRSAPALETFTRDFMRRARAGKVLNRSGRPFAPATIEGYEIALRLRALDVIEPRTGVRLGDLRVDAIDGRALQVAVDEIAGTSGRARARAAAAALSAVLADAYARGIRNELPPRLRLPPPPASRERLVSTTDLDRLLDVARADDETFKRSFALPLVALLASTGCRVGEVLGVVWGPTGLDLATKPPVLHVAAAKTPAGIRTVVLDADTAALLRRHRMATGRPKDGVAVFRDKAGRPLSRSGRVRSTLDRLAKAAGLEKLTAHMFRHGHATELASAGVPAATAAARLGHADGGALFLRVYQHVGDMEQVAALEALKRARKARKPGIRRTGDG